jgi:hypothetical protein
VQEKIAKYYYNRVERLGENSTESYEEERDASLGIFQLNMEVLGLQTRLSDTVADIVLHG